MAIVRSLIHLLFISSVLVDIQQEFRSRGKKHTRDNMNLTYTMTLLPEYHSKFINSCSVGQSYPQVLSLSRGQHSRFSKHFSTEQRCLLFKQLNLRTVALYNEQNDAYVYIINLSLKSFAMLCSDECIPCSRFFIYQL